MPICAVSLDKIGSHGNVPWSKFIKFLAVVIFFTAGVNAAIRIAIRPPVVKRATFKKKIKENRKQNIGLL